MYVNGFCGGSVRHVFGLPNRAQCERDLWWVVWRWRLFAGVGLLGGLGLHGWFVASWFGLLVQLVVRRRLCNGLQCWVIFGLSTVANTFDGPTIFIWVVPHAVGGGMVGLLGGRCGLAWLRATSKSASIFAGLIVVQLSGVWIHVVAGLAI